MSIVAQFVPNQLLLGMKPLAPGVESHSLYRRHIQHAVPKGAECHARMTNVCFIGEHDLQYCNVANDGGGDCCDQEEDRGNEEEGDTDPS